MATLTSPESVGCGGNCGLGCGMYHTSPNVICEFLDRAERYFGVLGVPGMWIEIIGISLIPIMVTCGTSCPRYVLISIFNLLRREV